MTQLPDKYKTWIDFYDDAIKLSKDYPRIVIHQEKKRTKMDAEICEYERLSFTIDEIKIKAFDEIQSYRMSRKEVPVIIEAIDFTQIKHQDFLAMRNKVADLLYHIILPEDK